MYKQFFVIFMAATLVGSLAVQDSYAENSRCSIDCEAPTIGVLDSGQTIVEKGLTINGQAFDATQFIQTIPPQEFVVGKPVKIEMTVYENSGVDALRYASIAINDYKDELNQNEKARIAFVQKFDGTQTVEILDFDKMLENVTVNATKIDQFRTSLVFSFTVIKPVSTTSLVIDMWDDSRSSRKYVLSDAIKVDIETVKKPEMEKAKPKKMTEKKEPKKKEEKTKEEKKPVKKPQTSKGKKKVRLPKQNY
jgi:hypothetical protein